MKKVSGPQVVTPEEALESPLPPGIQEALGELVGAAREGLLALSVGVGLSVVHEPMETEVEEVVGPRGKHNGDGTAKRHGHAANEVRPSLTRPTRSRRRASRPFDVERDSRSTSSPTGSPTPAYLRVETPASIRFITTHVSGSRSRPPARDPGSR
jgi:hypothetical protein